MSTNKNLNKSTLIFWSVLLGQNIKDRLKIFMKTIEFRRNPELNE